MVYWFAAFSGGVVAGKVRTWTSRHLAVLSPTEYRCSAVLLLWITRDWVVDRLPTFTSFQFSGHDPAGRFSVLRWAGSSSFRWSRTFRISSPEIQDIAAGPARAHSPPRPVVFNVRYW